MIDNAKAEYNRVAIDVEVPAETKADKAEPGNVDQHKEIADLQCRICLEDDERPLFKVCKCNAYVHDECLRHWVEVKSNNCSTCEICGSSYAVQRQWQFKVNLNPMQDVFSGCVNWGGWRRLFRVSVCILILMQLTMGFGFVYYLRTGQTLFQFPPVNCIIWVIFASLLIVAIFRCIEEIVEAFSSTGVALSSILCCCIRSQYTLDLEKAYTPSLEASTASIHSAVST
mmetsp:Transcript_3476/g.5020  ORF Transcript_3476/g.5020 Transcript_3476/m.5020 type:complete len:228 (-) Transcript_3476:233-916(-)